MHPRSLTDYLYDYVRDRRWRDFIGIKTAISLINAPLSYFTGQQLETVDGSFLDYTKEAIAITWPCLVNRAVGEIVGARVLFYANKKTYGNFRQFVKDYLKVEGPTLATDALLSPATVIGLRYLGLPFAAAVFLNGKIRFPVSFGINAILYKRVIVDKQPELTPEPAVVKEPVPVV